jgi:hypothetical protein
MVITCAGRLRLMRSSRAASVVDLPEPARGQVGERSDGVGQTELVEGHQLARDGPHDGAHRAALVEDVDAEATEPLDPVAEVELLRGLEQLVVVRLQYGDEEALDLLAREARVLGETLELAVDAHERLGAARQVQVGSTELDDALEEVIDVHAGSGGLVRHASAIGRKRSRVKVFTQLLRRSSPALVGRSTHLLRPCHHPP